MSLCGSGETMQARIWDEQIRAFLTMHTQRGLKRSRHQSHSTHESPQRTPSLNIQGHRSAVHVAQRFNACSSPKTLHTRKFLQVVSRNRAEARTHGMTVLVRFRCRETHHECVLSSACMHGGYSKSVQFLSWPSNLQSLGRQLLGWCPRA